MYTPVNPSFTVQKWGLKGSEVYYACFRDDILEGNAVKFAALLFNNLASLFNYTAVGQAQDHHENIPI